MLRRDVTYKNVDEEEVTKTFYFNLTKTDWLRLEAEHGGGLIDFFQAVSATGDTNLIFKEFEKFVLLTYGEKAGDDHLKSDALRERFRSTLAYDALVWELSTDAQKAADFIQGVMPKDLDKEAERIERDAEKNRKIYEEIQERAKEATVKTPATPTPTASLGAPPFPPPPAPVEEFTLPPQPS